MSDHQGAEALDNCKHCGSGELFLDVYGHHVACERCGISTRDYDSDAEAIAAWNRRPAPAAGGGGLPELPEPTNALSKGYGPLWSPLYTADQMRQYARDALAAAKDRQALNDKQIIRGWLDWTEPGCSATDAFVAGVRFTEKHHGVAPPSDSAAEGGGENAGSKEQ